MCSLAQSVISPHQTYLSVYDPRERASSPSTEAAEAESIIQFEINDEHHVNSATLAITVGQDMGKSPFQETVLRNAWEEIQFQRTRNIFFYIHLVYSCLRYMAKGSKL